jgi:outer membrane protein assembly factor BamB
MNCCRLPLRGLCLLAGFGLIGFAIAHPSPQSGKAREWPTYGGSPSRNLANTVEKGMPTDWSVEEGKLKNIKWQASLGTKAYGGLVVAGGKVYVATNNEEPRDPKNKGAKAVLMCFNEADGKFLWQALHDMPRPPVDQQAQHDGLCSSPTVEGDKLYYLTGAAEVVCASTQDGKAVWKLDLMKEFKVFPCFVSASCPLIVGDLLFVLTGHGRDGQGELHDPKAPSFIAVNKHKGTKVWMSAAPGENIVDGQWSSPAYGEAGGQGQVLFGGGDGWLYSFEPKSGKELWRFNCQPKKEKGEPRKPYRNYVVGTPVVFDGKAYLGVGVYPGGSAGSGAGHFWCLDLTGKGDVSSKGDDFNPKSPANKGSAFVWHFGGYIDPRPPRGRKIYMGRSCSSCAIQDGLVYVSDEEGFLYCLDAKDGKKYWEHEMPGGVWGSPLWVDGKIYLGTENGHMLVFAHGQAKKMLNDIDMGEGIASPPVAASGVLFVATSSKLYAIAGK